MSFKRIVELIETSGWCKWIHRPEDVDLNVSNNHFPDLFQRLKKRYERIDLFPPRSSHFSDNAWILRFKNKYIPLASFCGRVNPDDLWEYFDNCYVLANAAGDGADIIAVNCNADDNYGKVFFANMSEDLSYKLPLVADSIEDWFERTIHAGFNSAPYFYNGDYKDLGPAVPNAPDFSGIKGYLHLI